MISNLASGLDWRVITFGKQQQVDIDNDRENARRVTHEYTIRNIVYVNINGIYHKLDYKNQGLYIIAEVFTNNSF